MNKIQTLLFAPIKKWIYLDAWKKIFVALILGIIVGLLLGENAKLLKPIANLFINAIHMIIVPVVFTVIVCAIIAMEDFKEMRRISLRAVVLYSLSMAVATFVGISIALLIAPGEGLPLILDGSYPIQAKEVPTLIMMIESIIPKSPFGAFVDGNVLQIVVFSIFFGISINLAGEKAAPVANMFKSLSAVVFKFAGLVMSFSPYGIFAFIAWTFGNLGLQALWPLVKFVFTVCLACLIQILLVYALTLWLVTGERPHKFLKKLLYPMTFAFTTCSSAATLPISIACVQKNWGVSKSLADFLLPLGASFNLNGLSIYLSVTTIFAANIYGIELIFSDYILLFVTIILTSMGIAALPGSAIIVMGAVMSSVGIQLGALGIIIGVDRLNDMVQTATNVAGDIYATVLISHIEEKRHENTSQISEKTN